jgi:hypothetical protein
LIDNLFEGYSVSDGADDLKAWELREIEEDRNCRDPVGIEADVLRFNWMELARIQKEKYGELFTVILADPPWKIKMNLRYPLLTMTEIFEIPFHLL